MQGNILQLERLMLSVSSGVVTSDVNAQGLVQMAA